MGNKINATVSGICGLICLVIALITADVHWVIAGAIFRVAANIKEEKDGK
ncbi:MAG: hypothetical protein IJ403_01660 [Oscillospiraceae bacterium]|nr:hypothetical protein [Oscillospiraceae bacterium]